MLPVGIPLNFILIYIIIAGLTNTVTAVKNAQMAESPVLLLGGAAATLLKVCAPSPCITSSFFVGADNIFIEELGA